VIQYVTPLNIFYMASVYAPWGDTEAAREVYKCLEKNVKELSESGVCIVIGDMNARCPKLTGDKNPKEKGGNTWDNGPFWEETINNLNMKVARNEDQINQKK
jgi:hypothetical protein